MKNKWVSWVCGVLLASCWRVNAIEPLPSEIHPQIIASPITVEAQGLIANVVTPPPTNQATVTLSWNAGADTNLVVNIRQSADLTAPADTWPALANVTNAGAI